jgi:diacylglycerol kinase family enzyme
MGSRPNAGRRSAAVASIVLVAVAAALLVFGLRGTVVRLLATVVLLLLAVAGAWFSLTRSGWRRSLAVLVGGAALIGAVVVTVLADRANVGATIAGMAALVVAGDLARRALGRDAASLRAAVTPGTRVGDAARPVLLMNPRSGGGKAERFGLEQACLDRGIEPVILSPGDDLGALARAAIGRGADVVGMAGGDGSHAIVASIAAACDIAMVVVPAGTRNHLALDLGLDVTNVVGALDAFGDAVERRIDLAEVNGRTFVNNVSLGLYAQIVRSPEYRDAKVETSLATLRTVLGPGAVPFDLSFEGPDGATRHGAHVIQVSNNPYGTTPQTAISRPRLDGHRLGVMALEIEDDRSPVRLLSALAGKHPERYEGFVAWTAETFEVRSGDAVDVGLDGESLTMQPPLDFSIRPGVLRVRLPLHALGVSPAERAVDAHSAAVGVWRVVLGREATA